MSLSTRLTRAGLAILVFGTISAVLPSTGVAYAVTSGCPVTGVTTKSDDKAAQTTAAVIVGGSILAAVLVPGNDKKDKNKALNDFVIPPSSPN